MSPCLLGIILLGAYALVDVHYFIRALLTYFYARIFRRRIKITDPSEVYGVVLPSDGDFMLNHMNNGRYLREYDFARFDHGARCGMIEKMFLHRGAVAAHTIRYRLPLMMFSTYKIITTPVWWDEKFIYIEQQIITLADGIVRSVGYSKIAANFNVDEFVEASYPDIKKPPAIPQDMQKWIEYNQLSSKKLKSANNNATSANGHAKYIVDNDANTNGLVQNTGHCENGMKNGAVHHNNGNCEPLREG